MRKKKKAIPVQAWTGRGLQLVEATRFQGNLQMQVAMLSNLRPGHLYLPGNIRGMVRLHEVPDFRHTYSWRAWAHVTGGENAQRRVRLDQCASAIAMVKVPVFLPTLSCSNDTSVARIRVRCSHVTPRMLDDLCCVPAVAKASGWAEVDTWPLTHGGCYHVTEEDRTVCETRTVSWKIMWSLWNYWKHTHSC